MPRESIAEWERAQLEIIRARFEALARTVRQAQLDAEIAEMCIARNVRRGPPRYGLRRKAR